MLLFLPGHWAVDMGKTTWCFSIVINVFVRWPRAPPW